jgi:hypothetical protein
MFNPKIISVLGCECQRDRYNFYPSAAPNEQLRIADFLDWKTDKIDTLVAKKQVLIAKLKEKRSALISRTVTG